MTAPAGCAVTFTWGDGDHTFALPIGELRELQEKTDCGPEELYSRVTLLSEQQGGILESVRLGLLRPKANDIREVIRLGLVGGGMEPIKAAVLVARYVDARPRSENYLPARAILAAAIFGVTDDPAGKAKAPTTASQTASAATDGSNSPTSIAPAP